MDTPFFPQEGSFIGLGMKKETAPGKTNAPAIQELNTEIRQSIATFSGKWKLEILWVLNAGVHRFNELKRKIPGVTQHTLTQQLRELERDGMITRTVYPEVPPRVEYEITGKARGLRPVFTAIFAWSRGDDCAEDAGDNDLREPAIRPGVCEEECFSRTMTPADWEPWNCNGSLDDGDQPACTV